MSREPKILGAVICAGCAADFKLTDTRDCCGRPFCTPCYQVHLDTECEAPPPETTP